MLAKNFSAESPDVLKKYRLNITEYLKSRKDESNTPITTVTIDEIKRYPTPSVTEKIFKALRYITELSNNTTNGVVIFANDNENNAWNVIRKLLVSGYNDLCSLFEYLDRKGWAKIQQGQGWIQGSITIEGLLYLDSLERNRAESKTCFVAMWFSTDMNDLYEKGILPAILSNGYEAIRIDRKEHNNKIDDEIISEIRKSKFLIADFSCGLDGARGGVYFEAGFAQGLGIPVIFCVRESDLSKVHFDTRQFSHIVWKDALDLKERLATRISATIV